MPTTSPLKRAIKAARQAMAPQRYEAAGKRITCSHCGSDRFDQTGPTLVGYIYDCAACGARLLFTKSLKRFDDVTA